MDHYLPVVEYEHESFQEMMENDMKSEHLDALEPSKCLVESNGFDFFDFPPLDFAFEDKPFARLDNLDFDLFKEKDLNTDNSTCVVIDSNCEPEPIDVAGSWMNLSATSSYNIEEHGGRMVNPSQVLPTRTSSAKVNVTTAVRNSVVNISMPVATIPKNEVVSTQIKASELMNGKIYTSQGTNTSLHDNVSKASNLTNSTMVTTSTLTTPSAQPFVQHQSVSTTTQPKQVTYINKSQANRNTGVFGMSKQDRINRVKNAKLRRPNTPDEKTFPKPAYSYSCLIALALKNSTSGSLPVSEIYSFMCEHFPYFRTAPAGWKNSVRHNLSLNKCFEKIEKPVVSGNNQRKGCLWALNPTKLNKMDEEVQKWNKKGLKDIKDAMSYPDVLESLEKGEMKFESQSLSSFSEDEEEIDEVVPTSVKITKTEPPTERIKILNTMATSMVIPSNQKTINRSFGSNVKTFTQLPSTVSLPQKIQRTGNNIFQIRAADCDTSFLKPDSTITELNMQSFGSSDDSDLIDGSLGLLGTNESTSFVVKKLGSTSNLSLVYSPQTVQKHRVLVGNGKT